MAGRMIKVKWIINGKPTPAPKTPNVHNRGEAKRNPQLYKLNPSGVRPRDQNMVRGFHPRLFTLNPYGILQRGKPSSECKSWQTVKRS